MSSKKGLMGGMGFASVMAASVLGTVGVGSGVVQAAEIPFKVSESSNVNHPFHTLGTIDGTQMNMPFGGVEMGVMVGLDLQQPRFGGVGFSVLD